MKIPEISFRSHSMFPWLFFSFSWLLIFPSQGVANFVIDKQNQQNRVKKKISVTKKREEIAKVVVNEGWEGGEGEGGGGWQPKSSQWQSDKGSKDRVDQSEWKDVTTNQERR